MSEAAPIKFHQHGYLNMNGIKPRIIDMPKGMEESQDNIIPTQNTTGT